MNKDNETDLIETIQEKDKRIKELEEQIERNKSWVKFEIKNTNDILKQSENLAILMLKNITDREFIGGRGFETELEFYNRDINNLIKILETMKFEVYNNENKQSGIFTR